LCGGTEFTVRTLRFAWHITTLAWWGFAVVLELLALHSLSERRLSLVLVAPGHTNNTACKTPANVSERGTTISFRCEGRAIG